MKKDNLLYGIVGLLIGAIVGFMFANSVNRPGYNAATLPANSVAAVPGSNPALPPDHPPIGTSSGSTTGGSIPQVTEAIEKAKSEPQNFEAQMTAADLYYQIQRFDEAAAHYEAANKLKPGEVEPMIKLGNALFDAERYADAEKWYLMALEKTPKDITVRTDLGLTFFLREPRDLERAITEFKAALAIDPKHEITLQNLALAYREKGDEANLKKTIAEIKAINPNNAALPRLEVAPGT